MKMFTSSVLAQKSIKNIIFKWCKYYLLAWGTKSMACPGHPHLGQALHTRQILDSVYLYR
jgi:hypothetical protein